GSPAGSGRARRTTRTGRPSGWWSRPRCGRAGASPARPDRFRVSRSRPRPASGPRTAARRTARSTRPRNRSPAWWSRTSVPIRLVRAAMAIAPSPSPSRLLQLDQRAAEVLGMEEQHRLAVRAGLRRAVAEHAGALPPEPVARRQDVIDLVAQMVDAAVRVALEESRDRRILAERLEQLDLGVGQRDEH